MLGNVELVAFPESPSVKGLQEKDHRRQHRPMKVKF